MAHADRAQARERLRPGGARGAAWKSRLRDECLRAVARNREALLERARTGDYSGRLALRGLVAETAAGLRRGEDDPRGGGARTTPLGEEASEVCDGDDKGETGDPVGSEARLRRPLPSPSGRGQGGRPLPPPPPRSSAPGPCGPTPDYLLRGDEYEELMRHLEEVLSGLDEDEGDSGLDGRFQDGRPEHGPTGSSQAPYDVSMAQFLEEMEAMELADAMAAHEEGGRGGECGREESGAESIPCPVCGGVLGRPEGGHEPGRLAIGDGRVSCTNCGDLGPEPPPAPTGGRESADVPSLNGPGTAAAPLSRVRAVLAAAMAAHAAGDLCGHPCGAAPRFEPGPRDTGEACGRPTLWLACSACGANSRVL